MVSSHSLVEAEAIGAELNLGKYCTASLMVQCITYRQPRQAPPQLMSVAGYRPGWEPARCGRTSRQPRMKTAITAEASGRLKARPPSLTGLSRKSPTVAPSGRVRMKAAQNSVTRETSVQQ